VLGYYLTDGQTDALSTCNKELPLMWLHAMELNMYFGGGSRGSSVCVVTERSWFDFR
jgi:hypothetical protein